MAPRRELAAAGEEVGVQVGLDGERDRQPGPLGGGQVRSGVAGRVDDQGAAVAQVEQVGRVAEAFVDERDRPDAASGHAGLVAATTM